MTDLYEQYLQYRNTNDEQSFMDQLNVAGMLDAEQATLSTPEETKARGEKLNAALIAHDGDEAAEPPEAGGFGVWLEDTIRNTPGNITRGVAMAYEQSLKSVMGAELYGAAVRFERELIPGIHGAMNSFLASLEPQRATDRGMQEVAQFMVPFMGWSKAFGVAASGIPKAERFGRALMAEGMTVGTALDPHMQRLSDVAQSMGIESEVVSYLASDGGSEAENRIRNVIEATGVTVAAGGALYAGLQLMRGLWNAGGSLLTGFAAAGSESGKDVFERMDAELASQTTNADRVAAMVAEGKRNADIARELGLSPGQVSKLAKRARDGS